MTRHNLFLTTAISAICLTTNPAFAQQAAKDASSDPMGNDIVVTAQRRSETIQNVPIAVQAVSNEQLTRRGVTNLVEMQALAPSLTVQSNAGSVTPFIRGVGSTTIGSGLFASVATFVDGVYTGGLRGGVVDFDDAEVVQILAGPQGALYGRNATGGAMVIDTPVAHVGDSFSAKARARIGNYANRDFNIAVKSGLGSSPFAVALSASSHAHDGYVSNLNPAGTGAQGEDLNDRDSWSVRGALSFEPSDRFSAVLRASHFEQKDRSGYGFQAVGLDPNPAFGGLNGSQAYYAGVLQAFGFAPAAAFAAASNLRFSNRHNATYDGEVNGFANGILPGKGLPGSGSTTKANSVSLKLTYSADKFEISSLSAYTKIKATGAAEIINADPTSYPAGFNKGGIGFSGAFPDKNVQQEVQISSTGSPVEWLAGFTYYRGTGEQYLSADLFGLYSLLAARNNWSVNSKAFFAQTTVPLVGNLSATLGGRYTWEKYTLNDKFDPTNPFAQPGVINQGLRRKSSSKFTYTARLQYDSGPLLVYGGVTTGFKGASLSPTNPSSPAVDPEEITSYEIGLKWDVTPQLRLNAAGFVYDYKNIHINYVDSALGGATVLVNGTSADVKGAEAQVRYQPTPWLTLRANGLVLDTKYNNNVPTIGSLSELAIKGNRLAGAPKYTLGAGTDIVIPEFVGGNLTLTADLRNSSGYYFESENLVGTGGATANGFTSVDASLTYAPSDDRWSVSVWGSNIFDEEYFLSGVSAAGILRTALAAPPATYGVSFQVKFH